MADFDAIIARGQEIGWIYVAETGRPGEPVKVGWAKDPGKRLKTLQTAREAQLGLLGVIPGTRHLENELHRRLRRARLTGEWFERRFALKLLKPLIEEHGLFLRSRVAESRNSPEVPQKGRLKRQEFLAEIREPRDA